MSSIGIHITQRRAFSIGKVSKSSPAALLVGRPRAVLALRYAVSKSGPEKKVETVPPIPNGRYMMPACH